MEMPGAIEKPRQTVQALVVSDQVTPTLYPRVDADLRDRLQKVQVVISCGDLPPEFLVYLQRCLEVPLFYVKGNHDIRYEDSPPLGCRNLHASLVRFKGLRFVGFDGSRWYNGGPHQYQEFEMRRFVRRLWWALWRAQGVDVVITHAPPRFVHDAEDLCHRGFRTFNKLIARYQPAFLLHGHLHEQFTDPAQRVTRVGQTQVINCFGYHFVTFGSKDG